MKYPPRRVEIPSRPPPKHLVVKRVKKGFGARARVGDRLAVRFVGIHYKTGKVFELHWPKTFDFNLGAGEVRKGWERGLRGFRVGERRELILPPRLAYGPRHGTLFYLVELIAIERN